MPRDGPRTRFKLGINCIGKYRNHLHKPTTCLNCKNARPTTARNRTRHYTDLKKGEKDFGALVDFINPATHVEARMKRSMWNARNTLEKFCSRLATPKKTEVAALAEYIKVKNLSDLTIMDPLATSPTLVENFVQIPKNSNEKKEAKEAKEKPRRFKGEYFLGKGTKQNGDSKTPPVFFDPLALEHEERYRRKGGRLHIFCATVNHVRLLFPILNRSGKRVLRNDRAQSVGRGLPLASQTIG
ncbi:hypothetical protein CYMTET_7297 [Cymbomonas tetramitiformis]|uniref:Uncharacterized protein n=1 Tax=Cymbomonas tetramitiformis TaxID=36881 RepID=A0AAE0GX86_9CHLO|nr:hypothetical protein CYMTET_7297 [Cymbomonas tetramitiformis]